MEDVPERYRYSYCAWDESGDDVQMVIWKVEPPEGKDLKEYGGMNCYPVICLCDEKDRLPTREFSIPMYGDALVSFLDWAELALKSVPFLASEGKKRDDLLLKVKSKMMASTKLHPNTIQDLKNGDYIRYLHPFGNECGHFACLFSIWYCDEPHIHMGSPQVNASVARATRDDRGIFSFKKLLLLRIRNAWHFFCDLKHYDPRLGFDKDTIGLNFE